MWASILLVGLVSNRWMVHLPSPRSICVVQTDGTVTRGKDWARKSCAKLHSYIRYRSRSEAVYWVCWYADPTCGCGVPPRAS